MPHVGFRLRVAEMYRRADVESLQGHGPGQRTCVADDEPGSSCLRSSSWKLCGAARAETSTHQIWP